MGKNILFINDRLHAGGVEIVLESIIHHLTEKGCRVTIWAFEGSQSDLKKYPEGIRWRRFPFWRGDSRRFSPKWFFHRGFQILFEGIILKLKKWDTVVAFKEGTSMILASKLRTEKRIGWIHTDYSAFHWSCYNFHSNEEERKCMQRFDHMVCVSEAAKQSVIDTIGDPGNLVVRYNPIDVNAILAASQEELCRKPEGKTLLVSVGRLTEVKRFDMLIDICSRLSKVYPLELWIFGSGELEVDLRHQIEESDSDAIRLISGRKNPYPYFACADWVISSSKSESYGLTIQEALILGKPVLSVACPAIAESVPEGCGILVGFSEEDLEAGIRDILEHPHLNERCRASIDKLYNRNLLWADRLNAIAELLI